MVALFLLLLSAAHADEPMWAVQDVTSMRFLDAQVPGPGLHEGQRVEVIVREGDQVRVLAGGRLGWVAAASLTDVDPRPPAAPTGVAPAEFDLEAIKATLEASSGDTAPTLGGSGAPPRGH